MGATMTKTMQEGWIDQMQAALAGQGRRPLIEWLQRQRWFGGKGKPLADLRLCDMIGLATDRGYRFLTIVRVEYRGGTTERYVIPLTIRPRRGEDDRQALIELPESESHAWVCDATGDSETWMALYRQVARSRELAGQSGRLIGRAMLHGGEELAKPVQEAKVLSAEQSNTSVLFDRRVIMKLIRKMDSGINPDSEVLEFLTTQMSCKDAPALLGVMTYDDGLEDGNAQAAVAVLQTFVPNAGDGWRYSLDHLDRLLDEGGRAVGERGDTLSRAVTCISGPYLAQIRRLGAVTGGLHVAFASGLDQEHFRPEPITPHDIALWQGAMLKQLKDVFQDLRMRQGDRLSSEGCSPADIAVWEAGCHDRLEDLTILSRSQVMKIRHHGDYHLGQVLKVDDGFVVIDFEGEPARPLGERRAKVCPLKDVAGMLRSFDYAAQAALKQRSPASATDKGLAMEWYHSARATFLDGYRSSATPGQVGFLPATWDECLRVIHVYELDKALYELRYEMHNRPDWLAIPLAGIRALVA